MQHTVYEFFTRDDNERNWLIAILNEYHFEGFEETPQSLKAYVHTNKTTPAAVADILAQNDFGHIEFTSSDIEEKNWNEEWEKNFEPVQIAGQVLIRAPFHAPAPFPYEIVIEPKMSFGTGHHATTASVIELMLQQNFAGKTVLDFGSGTGVLAILAEKLNAQAVTAIDNEEWAYHNCIENIERNNCKVIQPILGDDNFKFSEKFDIILANINRNVILKNMANWCPLLHAGGLLIVSGILQSYEKDVVAEALKNGLTLNKIVNKDGWLAIAFNK